MSDELKELIKQWAQTMTLRDETGTKLTSARDADNAAMMKEVAARKAVRRYVARMNKEDISN